MFEDDELFTPCHSDMQGTEGVNDMNHHTDTPPDTDYWSNSKVILTKAEAIISNGRNSRKNSKNIFMT